MSVQQALLALLSVYGMFWMLLSRDDNPERRPVSSETSPLPPLATGSPAQEAAYQRALAEVGSYAVSTDEYGCPGAPLVTVGTDTGGARGLAAALADYATLWAFSRRFDLRGWLLPTAADRLGAHFSGVSLPELPDHCAPPRFIRCTLLADNCRRMRDKPRRNIWIDPDSRDAALLAAYRSELRHELQLPEAARRAAQLRIARLQRERHAQDAVLIGVHVSRAVLDPWLAQTDDGSTISAGYLRRAMEHYRRRHGRCLFLVVCDAPEWCAEHLSAPDVETSAGGGPDATLADLALLTSCHHTVMTSGPLGLMAALLTGGDLVAPANVTDSELVLTDSLQNVRGLHVTLIDVSVGGEV